jgi:hypothetical protein
LALLAIESNVSEKETFKVEVTQFQMQQQTMSPAQTKSQKYVPCKSRLERETNQFKIELNRRKYSQH